MNNQTFDEFGSTAPSLERRVYDSPRLSLLGEVGSMTESGSVMGNEQGMILGQISCSWSQNANMQYNMC